MNEKDQQESDFQRSDGAGPTPMAEDEIVNECVPPNSSKNHVSAISPESREVTNGTLPIDSNNFRVKFDVEAGTEKENDKLLIETPAPATENESGKDRNLRGWAVVIATWVIMIPVAGTLSSFGTLVESLNDEFNATKAETGWIASLAFGFTVGTCPLSTPLFTVFGARKVAGVGVITGSASLVITSFVPLLPVMFLTYGAMYGIAANFVYNSGMNLSGQYFTTKHQALATCLASAGISFGTLSMNPLSTYLTYTLGLGWRNTLRILAGMVFVVGCICLVAFKPMKTAEQKVITKLKRVRQDERDQVLERELGSNSNLDRQVVTDSLQNCTESKMSLAAQEIKKSVFDKNMYDCSVCVDFSFQLWMLGTLFWSLSFLFPLIFLIDYMETIGIEKEKGAYVLTAYGISEFLGRLLCAAVADRLPFGLSYVYVGSCGLMGLSTLLAPLGKALSFMYIYAAAVGINSGILNSLMYATTMQLFGTEKGRHVWGYINVMLALGMIIGPVQAGFIYDTSKSYVTAFYVGGGVFILSAITMLLIPVAKRVCPAKEKEAVAKRDVKMSETSRSGPRNSLRTALLSRDITKRQKASTKSKWKSGVETELKELNELHEEIGPV